MSRTLVLLCLALSAASIAQAQNGSDFERSQYSPASYYNYSEPADVTIFVNVWGTVRNPGLYEVPERTTLSHLLSLSGGPIVAQRSERENRTIEIRLHRTDNSGRSVIFETRMDNEIFAADQDPMLQDGDVLTVETLLRARFSWRDALPIVSTAASVGVVIAYFIR